MSIQPEPIYTIREAARILRLSVRKVQYEMRTSELTYILIGRSVRFRRSDLLSYIQRKR